MRLRYIVGIPYLYLMVSMGGNILWDALVIGILCGLTDYFLEGGGGRPT